MRDDSDERNRARPRARVPAGFSLRNDTCQPSTAKMGATTSSGVESRSPGFHCIRSHMGETTTRSSGTHFGCPHPAVPCSGFAPLRLRCQPSTPAIPVPGTSSPGSRDLRLGHAPLSPPRFTPPGLARASESEASRERRHASLRSRRIHSARPGQSERKRSESRAPKARRERSSSVLQHHQLQPDRHGLAGPQLRQRRAARAPFEQRAANRLVDAGVPA
jgi:hypothetical protein